MKYDHVEIRKVKNGYEINTEFRNYGQGIATSCQGILVCNTFEQLVELLKNGYENDQN